MGYHVVLSVDFDLDAIEDRAARDLQPRHYLWRVVQRLDAEVHGIDVQPTWIDRVLAPVVGRPEHWARDRELSRTIDDDDVVFATSAESIAMVLWCMVRRKRPSVIMYLMAPDRPRLRGLLGLAQLHRRIDKFVINTDDKRELLIERYGIRPEQILQQREQTDTRFFTPGPSTREDDRPLVFAAGREQRDYVTFAEATLDLDAEAVICAMSPNMADDPHVAIPDPLPDHLRIEPMPFPAFRQAYRDAAVVVVPLLANNYSAGLTVVMEALACRRPVVLTRTPGFGEELIDRGVVVGVDVGDADGMRRAIQDLLDDRDRAMAMAERGYQLVTEHHSSDHLVDLIVDGAEELGGRRSVAGTGEGRTM